MCADSQEKMSDTPVAQYSLTTDTWVQAAEPSVLGNEPK